MASHFPRKPKSWFLGFIYAIFKKKNCILDIARSSESELSDSELSNSSDEENGPSKKQKIAKKFGHKTKTNSSNNVDFAKAATALQSGLKRRKVGRTILKPPSMFLKLSSPKGY